MRFLISFFLVPLLLASVLAGCKTTQPGFPVSKYGPKPKSPTAPSECLGKGKSSAAMGDWAAAYRWYARGGGWNTKGRSTGFPSPGTISEPEESQRFLCIVGFLDATRHLISQGVRVDADGVHPLYVSLSEASRSIAYFRSVNPHGYAGLTAAQIAALQQGADIKAAAVQREMTMDNLEQVDHSPSHLQSFQNTMSAGRAADPASTTREGMDVRQPPAIVLPQGKQNDHTEAARLYRQLANKYPEGDPQRQALLDRAADEERKAANP